MLVPVPFADVSFGPREPATGTFVSVGSAALLFARCHCGTLTSCFVPFDVQTLSVLDTFASSVVSQRHRCIAWRWCLCSLGSPSLTTQYGVDLTRHLLNPTFWLGPIIAVAMTVFLVIVRPSCMFLHHLGCINALCACLSGVVQPAHRTLHRCQCEVLGVLLTVVCLCVLCSLPCSTGGNVGSVRRGACSRCGGWAVDVT